MSGYHLLYHLTLALAGVCLATACAPFLPEVWLVLPGYLVLVALAWRLQGLWTLPNWGANVLGVLLAGVAGWWMVIRLDAEDEWTREIPLAAALVPLLGPVVMALCAIRLFRPRSTEDFWTLEGLGVMQVALGCVLGNGMSFAVPLLAYLLVGLWAVAAHYRHAGRAGATATAGRGGGPGRGLGLRWAALVGVLVVPLYLLTPRVDGPEWDPFARFGVRDRPPQEEALTGFSGDIDLNREGPLEPDESTAFTVAVTDRRDQPRSLPADVRWRGVILDSYSRGRWTSGLAKVAGSPLYRPVRMTEHPPAALELTFSVRLKKAGWLFLADPVVPGPRPGMVPVRSLTRTTSGQRVALFFENGGTAVQVIFLPQPEYRYVQTYTPLGGRDRYPARRVLEPYQTQLLRHRVEGLNGFTADLLRRLARRSAPVSRRLQLPDLPEGAELCLHRSQWETAARLLNDHLARSGEYTYSLYRRRESTRLDPALDFLVNVKQGPCERYAAALALMLRSVGVPTRVVKGFRGAVAQSDGSYAVKHSQAHAWVEALVSSEADEEFDWLILDPTPDVDAPGPAEPFSLARWLQTQQRSGEALWRELVVEFSAADQADLWLGLARQVATRGGWLLLAAGLVGLLWAGARLRRSREAPGPAGAHARLVRILTRRTPLRPQLGQTPREFAGAAGAYLAGKAPEVADVPDLVVEAFYRARYGGRPPSPEAARALTARVDALAAALRS
jgi:transglutaminase-like putative cysteine protease